MTLLLSFVKLDYLPKNYFDVVPPVMKPNHENGSCPVRVDLEIGAVKVTQSNQCSGNGRNTLRPRE
jgi:hypothetical protein